MLGKISILFILSWLLFLVCPLYAQDTQTDVASVELIKQVQEMNERIQKLENTKLKAQSRLEKVENIATIVLAVFTLVLAVSTIFLARATQRYSKAAKELVRVTHHNSVVQLTHLSSSPGGLPIWFGAETSDERNAIIEKYEKKIAEKFKFSLDEILQDEQVSK